MDGGGKRLPEELGVDGTEAGEDGGGKRLPEELRVDGTEAWVDGVVNNFQRS